MTQILVRDIEDEVQDRLRQRAEMNGRTFEEEVRDILRTAVLDPSKDGPESLGTWIKAQFAHCHLQEGEELPAWRGHSVRAVRFE